MKSAKILTILVLVLVLAISAVGSTQGKMYWTDSDTDKIQRANMDGSGVEDLVTGLSAPYSIALDVSGGKMYWVDGGTDKIQRANLDGSGVEDVVTGLSQPFGIALDVSGGKMYWEDGGTDKIQRANLDGSGIEDLVTGLFVPYGIALDVAGGKMYWTDIGTDKIQRANLDGSAVEDLVVTGLSAPLSIALDVAAGKMYWVDNGTDKIQRANLDGSTVEDLVTGLTAPYGIALDVAGGKMYWTDQGTDKIQRANFDGSGVEDVVTGLSQPFGIALVPPIYTFSYQGHLYDNNSVADGLYDFAFKLYDADSDSNQVGGNVYKADEDVIDGYFTVELDFGAAFAGDARWLEIGVRPGQLEDPNNYTTLSPRQEVLPTPYAIYAKTAGYAETAAYAETAGGAVGGITGSGTPNYIAKFTDSNSIGDSIIYETAGNVGIGDASPGAKLTVNGAILRSGSTMYGSNVDTHINLGTSSTTGTSGQNYSYATVGGGELNTARYNYTTVGGGYDNDANGDYATVGGGIWNNARYDYATISGGGYNDAGGNYSTVCGGMLNAASNSHATIGGGWENTASGQYATIPGGLFNNAGGDYSFAAGRRAKSNHQGAFVWADSTDVDFASTANNQFLIRASGGVGIGTGNPQNKLDVEGAVAIGASYSGTETAPTNGMVIEGNVGIGTPSPTEKLEVNGNLKVTGNIVGGLKTYDSGWFAVSTNTTYSKTHNLGTTKVLAVAYVAADSSGTHMSTPTTNLDEVILVSQITTTTCVVRTKNWIARHWDGSSWVNSSHIRIIMLALE